MPLDGLDPQSQPNRWCLWRPSLPPVPVLGQGGRRGQRYSTWLIGCCVDGCGQAGAPPCSVGCWGGVWMCTWTCVWWCCDVEIDGTPLTLHSNGPTPTPHQTGSLFLSHMLANWCLHFHRTAPTAQRWLWVCGCSGALRPALPAGVGNVACRMSVALRVWVWRGRVDLT